MTSPRRHDPIAALNQVLSEVIDEVAGIKQARRAVPKTHELHGLLDQLFSDLRGWADQLMERDRALGISALSVMPSVAGREPANLWPHGADDQEVRGVVDRQLGRLAEHAAAALAAQENDESRAPLAEVERGILAYRQALADADRDQSP